MSEKRNLLSGMGLGLELRKKMELATKSTEAGKRAMAMEAVKRSPYAAHVATVESIRELGFTCVMGMEFKLVTVECLAVSVDGVELAIVPENVIHSALNMTKEQFDGMVSIVKAMKAKAGA